MRSLSHDTLGSIKHLIITGRLRPGQFINERDLSGQLGISRTPLREALFQLVNQGFVRNVPHKGFVVEPVKLKETIDILELKLCLQVFCVEQSFERGGPLNIEPLRQKFAACEDAVENDDFEALVQRNLDFDGSIVALLCNRTFDSTYQEIADKQLRIGYFSMQENKNDVSGPLEERKRIMLSLEHGDRLAAIEALQHHKEQSVARILRAANASFT